MATEGLALSVVVEGPSQEASVFFQYQPFNQVCRLLRWWAPSGGIDFRAWDASLGVSLSPCASHDNPDCSPQGSLPPHHCFLSCASHSNWWIHKKEWVHTWSTERVRLLGQQDEMKGRCAGTSNQNKICCEGQRFWKPSTAWSNSCEIIYNFLIWSFVCRHWLQGII